MDVQAVLILGDRKESSKLDVVGFRQDEAAASGSNAGTPTLGDPFLCQGLNRRLVCELSMQNILQISLGSGPAFLPHPELISLLSSHLARDSLEKLSVEVQERGAQVSGTMAAQRKQCREGVRRGRPGLQVLRGRMCLGLVTQQERRGGAEGTGLLCTTCSLGT